MVICFELCLISRRTDEASDHAGSPIPATCRRACSELARQEDADDDSGGGDDGGGDDDGDGDKILRLMVETRMLTKYKLEQQQPKKNDNTQTNQHWQTNKQHTTKTLNARKSESESGKHGTDLHLGHRQLCKVADRNLEDCTCRIMLHVSFKVCVVTKIMMMWVQLYAASCST